MATVVQLPKDTRFGGIGNLAIGLLMQQLQSKKKKKEEEANQQAMLRAQNIFSQALEGGVEVPPEKRPVNLLAGTGFPTSVPRRPVKSGEILRSVLEDPIAFNDPQAVQLAESLEEQLAGIREDQAAQAGRLRLAEAIPEDAPQGDLAAAALTTKGLKSATRTAVFNKAKLTPDAADKDTLGDVTLFRGAGDSQTKVTLEVPRSVREQGRGAVLKYAEANGLKGFDLLDVSLPSTGDAKPSETQLTTSAVLQNEGLEATPQNKARARLFVKGQTATNSTIDKQTAQVSEEGFLSFKKPIDRITNIVAKSKVKNAYLKQGMTSTGEAARFAIDEARKDIRTGAFIPDEFRTDLLSIATYFMDITTGSLTQEEVLDLLRGFKAPEDALTALQSHPDFTALFGPGILSAFGRSFNIEPVKKE